MSSQRVSRIKVKTRKEEKEEKEEEEKEEEKRMPSKYHLPYA